MRHGFQSGDSAQRENKKKKKKKIKQKEDPLMLHFDPDQSG